MTIHTLVFWALGLYAVRVIPAVLFLIRYRVRPDWMADFFRVVMVALIVAVAPQIVYLFNPSLIAQLGQVRVPWSLATLSLFVDGVWAAVAWWLYLLWLREMKD